MEAAVKVVNIHPTKPPTGGKHKNLASDARMRRILIRVGIQALVTNGQRLNISSERAFELNNFASATFALALRAEDSLNFQHPAPRIISKTGTKREQAERT
jgi:hypothetical protein